MRHFYRVKPEYRERLSGQRALRYPRLEDMQRPNSSTTWKIENDEDYRGQKSTLENYLSTIGSSFSFEEACERALPKPERPLDWDDIWKAAHMTATYLEDFGANLILTFSGHSWIYASYVLATLPRDRMLSMPVYLAHVVDWEPSTRMPRRPGFTTLMGIEPEPAKNTYGFTILVPESFPKNNGKHRVGVIDDSITSGQVPPVIARFLKEQGYREGPNVEGSFKIACCAFFNSPAVARRPDHFVIPTKSETFHFPWGDSIWFPRRTGSER
jgi:hypothetical protein